MTSTAKAEPDPAGKSRIREPAAALLVSDDICRLATSRFVTGENQTGLADLIRYMQFREGRMPCFCETWSAPCAIGVCPFASACTSHLRIRAAVRH